MSENYIDKEITKIINDNKDQELAASLSAAWILAHFKGVDLKIFHTKNTNPLAEYFVIGSVQNSVQAQSAARALEKVFKGKFQVKSLEGFDKAEWILLDTGDVVVHIFQESMREIYDLDNIWKEYEQVKIPNEYYHSEPFVEPTSTTDDLKNYF